MLIRAPWLLAPSLDNTLACPIDSATGSHRSWR
jgi:hypothetical protein